MNRGALIRRLTGLARVLVSVLSGDFPYIDMLAKMTMACCLSPSPFRYC